MTHSFAEPSRHYPENEKLQLFHRVPAPLLRHLLAQARAGQLSSGAVAAELGRSLNRFDQRRGAYLRACAHGQAETWAPGTAGGDHPPDWPANVIALLTKLLSSTPPASSSAVASERHRRLGFQTDRASGRRWAVKNQLAPDTRYKKVAKPVKRWQARAEKRSVLRPVPAGPWWPYVWSQQTRVRVGDDGNVPVGLQRQALAPPRAAVSWAACGPTGTSSTCVILPLPTSNRSFCSTVRCSNTPSQFWAHTLSQF